jgi:hypothetical protein
MKAVCMGDQTFRDEVVTTGKLRVSWLSIAGFCLYQSWVFRFSLATLRRTIHFRMARMISCFEI